eukprot:XP_016661353.1 PREDICTED: 52 kDa repressor of the inhibitor of the protein kinase-like [Acyrthosiphon pisum]
MNNTPKITTFFTAIRSTESTCSSETPSETAETLNLKRSIDEDAEQKKDNAFVELKIWKVKISNGDVNTKTGLDALMKCSKTDFPNIHFLIKIFCTLPVSTATPERSFSTLKRLKSYLRSTMNEDRLNGLALMSIHRDIPIDVDAIIDEMALTPRKLDFVL